MILPADATPPPVSTLQLEHALLAYDLARPIGVHWLRRGFNDHYLVTAGKQHFILRVYLNGKPYARGPHDFQAEVELLASLKQGGVNVCAPIPRHDGTLLGRVGDVDREQYVALFEYAVGRETTGQDLSARAARQLGVTVAQVHRVADEAHLGQNRYVLDETFLVDRPIAALRRMFGQEANFLLPYGERLKTQLQALPRGAGAFGYIHADLHLGNVRIDEEDRCTLFDFDHGALGWRAYDLAVLRLGLDDALWKTLLAGYRSVRVLSADEVGAMPLLAQVRQLWDPGDWVQMWETGAWGQSSPNTTGFLEHLRRLVSH